MLAFTLALVVGTSVTLGVVYNWVVFRDSVETKTADALVFARATSQNAEPYMLLKDMKGLQRLAHAGSQDVAIQRLSFLGPAGIILATPPATDQSQHAAWDASLIGKVTPAWSRIERVPGGFTVLVPVWPASEELDLGLPDSGAKGENQAIGFVKIEYTLGPIKSQMVSRAVTTGFITLLVVAVAWAATTVLVRRFLRPVLQLVSTTSAIAGGDLTHRATEEAFGEIGELAQSFNHMARRLQESYESIEKQVEERTAQLEQRTHELEYEITHRMEVENELRRSKDAAEAASRAKSEFLANMSHELRTPLNGVIGMTELLLQADLSPRQQHYAQTAKLSANTLLTLINDILDLSKVEAGKLELDQIEFDLVDTIEDVCEVMAHKAAEKGIELTCFVDPAIPPHLIGDPARLQQIVTNLTNNALKFTEKGEVVVTAARVEETGQDVHIRVSVKDTGIGIPASRLECLFKPFSQVDASTTRRYGGTGLGLRISKQLAELMGGTVGVESVEGEGSTFRFSVRLRKLDSPARLAKRRTLAPRLKGLRVLVVDDNATNREILCQQLIGWGMTPESAVDGKSALEALRKPAGTDEGFSLAILDMQMPGMDGAELGTAIRSDSGFRALPLIMLTSMTDDTSLQRLHGVGFSATVSKPAKQSILLDAILRAIDEAGAPVQQQPLTCAGASAQNRVWPEHLLLLVEDNVINQDVAVGILEAAGLKVEVADNGQAGLDAVKKRRYHLVMMDCQMPVMDGFEATRQIRTLEQHGPLAANGAPRIPIIALTANALRGDRDICLAAGMDDYVSKPLDPPILISTIERHLKASLGEGGALVASQDSPACETPADPVAADANLAAPPVSPMFDLPSLVTRCPGGADMIAKFLHRFEIEVDRLSGQLTQALNEHNLTLLAQTAHGVKGMAANLSAVPLYETVLRLEQSAKAGAACECEALLKEVHAMVASTVAAVPEAIEELKRG